MRMGNYKFRLSDMIPNAWFYKLRDMSLYPSRRRTPSSTYLHQAKHTCMSSQIHSFPRKSLYFTRDLQSRSRSTTVDYETRQKYDTSSYDNSPADLSFSSDNTGSCPSSCSFTANESHTNDIVLDVSGDLPLLELRPILTHPPPMNAKNEQRQRPHVAAAKDAISSSKPRKSSVTSSGVKLRVNSPKIGGRRSLKGRKRTQSPVAGGSSSSLSDSFVVVKTSLDPYRDFRASMMEMIVENNIRTNKDLEELLACYLSLNSDDYHDLIIRVFKQIWLDFVCSSSK